jgi:tetratricopeptide (TPR) repeat protein
VGQVSPQMSEKYLSKVIESKGRGLGKDDIILFNRLGIALRGQGKWREAIENYSRALEISPDDEGLYYNMGMAYFDGGDKRMAAKCFDSALEKNPLFYKTSEGASLNLGTIYSEIREPEKAIEFLKNALALNPANATARRRLEALTR